VSDGAATPLRKLINDAVEPLALIPTRSEIKTLATAIRLVELDLFEWR
jgi:hypothetical protein